jgi:ABC-type transporter Mla MlaB component
MLRITARSNGPDETKLVLEGRLAGEAVSELRRVTDECALAGKRVVLDLISLQFADATGLALLRRLIATSAQVQRASAFVSALLGESLS